MELVSVIVPVYNAENTVKYTVDSILAQDYENIEVVIVDDGSTDKSRDIICDIAKRDRRIIMVCKDNSGVSNTRNTGLHRARGRYLVFVDSDDILMPRYISTMVQAFDSSVDLISVGYHTIDEQSNRLLSFVPQNMDCKEQDWYLAIEELQRCKGFNVLWNKMFKTKIIVDNQLEMDETISMGEDFLFILDYLNACKNNIKILNSDLYEYRISRNGLQAKYKDGDSLGRYSRAKVLNRFYYDHNFPTNGIKVSMLNLFYVMLLESNDIDKTLKTIYSFEEYAFCVKGRIKCPLKKKLFRLSLKMKVDPIINLMFGHRGKTN